MRRLLSSVLVVFGVAVTGAAGPAAAGPATGTSVAAPGPSGAPAAGVGGGAEATAKAGKKICTVTDARLVELSGMVATKKGFIVINDSSNTPANERVYFLNNKCAVVDEVPFTGNGPRDTEDLALSPDGKTLWIADIGDNANNKPRRSSIALWSMPVDGSKKPVLNRLRYPDGPRDAEALLINGNGIPIIVTKDAGTARLYTPTAALKPNDQKVAELKLAGEVKIPPSTTSNPLVALGRLLITGAAQPAGGGKAVLRTYADAFEWDVTDGDVLAALKQPPRMTPLPDEPFGEAITYSPDGKSFLTVADRGNDPASEVPINILQYQPVAAAPPAAAAPGGPAPARPGSGPSWFDKLSLQDITYLIGGVGVFGALLVALGIIGIFRARRRPPAAEPTKKKKKKAGTDEKAAVDEKGAAPGAPTEQAPPVAEVKPAAAGAGRPKGAVYGSGSGVYGGRPAAPPVVPQPPPLPPSAPTPVAPPPTAPAPVGSVYGGTAPRVYGGGQYRQAPAPEPPNGGNGHGAPRNGYVDHGAGVYGRPRSNPAGYPDEPGNGQEPRVVH